MNNEIIIYFLRSGICLMIFYSLYWLFLRKEKIFRFNRYYLLSSVVLSCIFPLINFSNLFSKEVEVSLPGTIVQNFIMPQNIEPIVVDNNSNIVQQPQFNLLDYILYTYIAILAILFIRMIVGLIKLFIMYKRGNKYKTGDYTIVYTKDNIAPFSFFSFIFLNEDNVSKNNINEIIAHERTHINQYHTFDILFLNIAAIVQWYNPFIWLIKRALKETHEFLADEKVIAQGFDSAIYSELLIKQIAGAKAMDFANCFNHLLIKKRLIMLKKLKPGKLASLKTILILPLAIILAISFNIQGQDKSKKVAEIGPPPKTHRTEAQREARIDSILNLKSPNFNDMNEQAIIIGFRNAVLPKDEKDGNGFIYMLGTAVDYATGRIGLVLYKEKATKEGKILKDTNPIQVNIINYKEFENKLPVVSQEELKKLKSKIKSPAISKGYYLMESNFIKQFKNNTEYWKTHN